MKFVFLTLKNIKKFVILHTAMFVTLILVQTICCFTAFISCGMANNMYYVEEVETDSKFSFSFESNEEVENTNVYSTFNEETGKWESYFLPPDVSSGEETKDLRIYTIEHEHTPTIGEAREKIDEFIEYMKQYNLTGASLILYHNKVTDLRTAPIQFLSYIPINSVESSSLDDIYLKSREKIILAPVYDKSGDIYEEGFYDLGKTYDINGYEYKCVAHNEFYVVPYYGVDDNFVVACLNINAKQNFSLQQINDAVEKFNSLFGTDIQETWTPEPFDPLEMQLNRMVYVISILIMIVIILAIAKFYNYILSNRIYTLSVMSLCGCTRFKIHVIYMLEIIITMLFTSVAGALLFKYLMFDYIAYYYPSFIEFYKPHIFIIVLLVYLAISFIILSLTIIPATKVSIVEMQKKN